MTAETASRRLIVLGCVSAGVGVAAGAFGAHGLKAVLEPPMLAVYDTATRYQMYHAFGILLSGLAVRLFEDRSMAIAGWLFAAGTLIFSGSLYGVSLLGIRWLGALTPLGGVAFIVGWGWLGWRAARSAAR